MTWMNQRGILLRKDDGQKAIFYMIAPAGHLEEAKLISGYQELSRQDETRAQEIKHKIKDSKVSIVIEKSRPNVRVGQACSAHGCFPQERNLRNGNTDLWHKRRTRFGSLGEQDCEQEVKCASTREGRHTGSWLARECNTGAWDFKDTSI